MSHSPFHRKHKEEENTEAWLMSYADMITLLLCFFIIFVAVSEPKSDKLEAITQGLGGRFGSLELASPFLGVFRSLQGVVEDNQMGKEVAVERTVSGIHMELSANTFFQAGQAAFKPDAEPVLNELVGVLTRSDYTNYVVAIEVYTDDEPINTPLFPSNWELSAMRAAHMVRYFISKGFDAKRLKATGFGDARPKVPNTDLQGEPIPENRERNQRVVLRLEREL